MKKVITFIMIILLCFIFSACTDEKILNKEYQKGYRAGLADKTNDDDLYYDEDDYQENYDKGYEEGVEDGKDQYIDEYGYPEDIQIEAYGDGYEEGYNNGYDDGFYQASCKYEGIKPTTMPTIKLDDLD